MNVDQVISTLAIWETQIGNKIDQLINAARTTKILYYILNIFKYFFYWAPLVMMLVTPTAIGVKQKDEWIFMLIYAICLLIGNFLSALNDLFQLSDKSSKCSTTQKRYQELLRELEIEKQSIQNHPNGELPYEKFKNLLLYYSAREQNILEDQPLLLWYDRKKQSIISNESEEFIKENSTKINEMHGVNNYTSLDNGTIEMQELNNNSAGLQIETD